jgi:hypothetical protein
MARILTVLSTLLAGIVVVGVHPNLNPATIVCIILITAGGIVVYHEVSGLNASGSYPRDRNSGPMRSYVVPPPEEPRWIDPAIDRRADAIELRPGDSVEQIARVMIATSFRQAKRKYHAGHGEPHDLPGRIVQAQSLLLTALRR